MLGFIKTILSGFKNGLYEFLERRNVSLEAFDGHALVFRHVNGASVKDAHHALAALNNGVVERLALSNFDVKVKQSVQAT